MTRRFRANASYPRNRLVPPAGFAALPGVLPKADRLCIATPRDPIAPRGE